MCRAKRRGSCEVMMILGDEMVHDDDDDSDTIKAVRQITRMDGNVPDRADSI